MNVSELARICGLSRLTVYKYLGLVECQWRISFATLRKKRMVCLHILNPMSSEKKIMLIIQRVIASLLRNFWFIVFKIQSGHCVFEFLYQLCYSILVEILCC